jgi:hypothetical protein
VKVLHLPRNIASQMSITVRALRELGVEARGIVVNNHLIQDQRGLESYTISMPGQHATKRIKQKAAWWFTVLSAIQWADVIHWHYGVSTLHNYFDLRWAAFLKKPRIVEFWGSDIRNPSVAAADNPYLERLYKQYPEFATAELKNSQQSQSQFARYGFAALVPGAELSTYVCHDSFPAVYTTQQRLILAEFEPSYPDSTNPRPLLVHIPSHKQVKGTEAVLRAVDTLRNRYEFDFELIHGLPHDQALAMVRRADLVLDQFVIGDHGLAAIEAMALGKPTLCFIKDALLAKYPPDFPLVNANQENLVQVLEGLLVDGQKRHEIGRRSRHYVEQYHDAHKIARQLLSIYQELIAKKQK